MKKTIILFLFVFSLKAYSQSDTTIYYQKSGEVTDNKDNALISEVLTKKSDKNFLIQGYYKDGKKWRKSFQEKISVMSDTLFIVEKGMKKTSVYVYRRDNLYFVKEFDNSILICEGTCKLAFPLIIEGNWKKYSPYTGSLIEDCEYKNNRMISNKYWINNKKYITDVFSAVDSIPVYVQGDRALFKFVSDSINYPYECLIKGITGRPVVKLIVLSDGSVTGIDIEESAHPFLNAEALRVVRKVPANWIPGMIGDKKVNTIIRLPIMFDIKGPLHR